MRAASLSAILFAASPAAFADTPLDKALAAPDEGPAYMFDLHIEDGKLNADTRVNPSLPEGERVSLLAPEVEDLDEEASERLARLQENTTGKDIWCSRLSRNIPDDARLISELGEAAVYAFKPIGTKEDGDMEKVYKHLSGRVTVSKEKPGIIAYEVFSEKPFKPAMVARIDTFHMKLNCDYAPDGRTYVKDMDLSVAGSAMMQDFAQTERREVSNLVALQESAAGQR